MAYNFYLVYSSYVSNIFSPLLTLISAQRALGNARHTPTYFLCSSCSLCLGFFSPKYLLGSFLTSFKSLLRCHLSKEAQPDTRVNYVYCLSLPLPVYKLYENGDFCLELCLAHRRLIFSNICGLIEVNKQVLSVYSQDMCLELGIK